MYPFILLSESISRKTFRFFGFVQPDISGISRDRTETKTFKAMSWIEDAINELVISQEGKINSRIACLEKDLEIPETEAIAHCYCVKLDGQGNPRTKDLVDFIATKIVDYSIPKKSIDEAKESFIRTNSTDKILELQAKAKMLFTDLKQTGELGEMLLYVLVQEVLGFPQLISKMSLKTSGKLHYQGADGIHVHFDSKDDTLSLYWGESKMEKTLNSGLTNCFNSLKGFLLDTYGSGSVQERDLMLITQNIFDNTNNPKLEDAIVKYFDLDDDASNKLKYKGVCFVGFDSKHYPSNPHEKTLADIKKLFEAEIESWLKTSGSKIKNHVNLEKFEIHVFLIPFPSVEDLRNQFLKIVSR
ncbi:MAG: DUF1837 domain-containing protein [Flavobacteriales bacterium]|nr:DUF1837 domain-containing protein [Flavobacteriales bacterium]